MHSIDASAKNKHTRINNRFWLEIIVEPLAQNPHMYSHIDSDCGQVFVLLIPQMFAWWCYRMHYVHKRKHSSKLPAACFSTVRASQWTSLDRSGGGDWGQEERVPVQWGPIWRSLDIAQVVNMCRGIEPGRGGGGSGPCMQRSNAS